MGFRSAQVVVRGLGVGGWVYGLLGVGGWVYGLLGVGGWVYGLLGVGGWSRVQWVQSLVGWSAARREQCTLNPTGSSLRVW